MGGGVQGDHGGNMMVGGPGGSGGGDANLSDENRRVLEWIAQVLSTNAREAALLELSKKREQVPELALILWHSFGE
jgi:CCR4-NOT transcription complex subunit 9